MARTKKIAKSVAEGTYKSLLSSGQCLYAQSYTTFRLIIPFFRTSFPAKARNTPCTRPLLFCRHYEASDDGKDGSLGGVMVMVYRGQSVGLRGLYGLVQTTTDLGDFPDEGLLHLMVRRTTRRTDIYTESDE
ncbi:hypothetical protein B0H13DRAFT_1898853 [Mycena leptocephala]|nr:hypothetical protein B0H13DRAFT_1898853 [Mycena leptocephala]